MNQTTATAAELERRLTDAGLLRPVAESPPFTVSPYPTSSQPTPPPSEQPAAVRTWLSNRSEPTPHR